jgi:uncharacterized membrane protein YccF (DUF307 family)
MTPKAPSLPNNWPLSTSRSVSWFAALKVSDQGNLEADAGSESQFSGACDANVRRWVERPQLIGVLCMRFVLNLLWLVLAGFWMFLSYIVVGTLWCITIIGIPFGVASFRIGLFALWPFGQRVVNKTGSRFGSRIGNVLWFVLSGVWLAIGHAVTGVFLCITVIGIPLGLANFKLIPISLFPLGKDIVST